MLRRDVLKRTGLALASAMLARAEQKRRPNVLILLAGQWRGQSVPGSDPDLQAPALARLSREGVQFTRGYTSYPESAPARAALLTGRFPHACGVVSDSAALPVEQRTLADALRSAGYRTGFIGKWDLDGPGDPGFVPPGVRRHGFEYWAGFNRGDRFYSSRYFRDTPEPVLVSSYEPDYQTDLAVEFVRNNRSQPFFLFLSWGPPHPPRNPPSRVANMYDPASVHLHPNVPADIEGRVRSECAAYDAVCTAIDENVGRLLNELDRLNLAHDTIVVFTSDHGDMLGSHGLEGKDTPYEEAVRVPLFVRYPAVLGPKQTDQLVSNVDVVPTLLDLCDPPAMEGIQGVSVAAGHTAEEAIFVEGRLNTSEEWRMVVRGLDKLVVNREMEPVHLYNLGQDPFELENLTRDVQHRLKRDELKALIAAWMRRTEYSMDASGLKKRS